MNIKRLLGLCLIFISLPLAADEISLFDVDFVPPQLKNLKAVDHEGVVSVSWDACPSSRRSPGCAMLVAWKIIRRKPLDLSRTVW